MFICEASGKHLPGSSDRLSVTRSGHVDGDGFSEFLNRSHLALHNFSSTVVVSARLSALGPSYMSYTMATHTEENSLLGKLDAVAPIAQFDAFPKLPSSYKARSESRGIMTMLVALLAFTLVLNDISEYIWGWPDQEFSVDDSISSLLNINIDMVVAMPCGCE